MQLETAFLSTQLLDMIPYAAKPNCRVLKPASRPPIDKHLLIDMVVIFAELTTMFETVGGEIVAEDMDLIDADFDS